MDDVALGRLLIDRGLVHRDAVGAAYRSRAPGRSLADELIALRLVTPEALRSVLQPAEHPSAPGRDATIVAPPRHGTTAPTGAPGAGGALKEGELVDDRYRIGRLLGKGGMGAVYLANDARTGGQVAIKVLLCDGSSSELLQRFEREAQLAARVDHAGGIVRVHAYGMHRGLPYCALELVEGTDLGKVLEQGPLEPMRLARILERTARALHACHEAGLVHRDVKPGNVLLRATDDEPRLADFGLAKAADLERMTRSGVTLGTPAYMAPEQADDASVGIDARADVYALGAILYHGLAGRAPFGGGALHEVLVKLLTDDPKPPHELNPDAPRDLEAVALKALQKGPADRYPTARALADELARFQRGEPVQARPLGRWDRFRRRLARRDRRALATAVGAVAASALLVAGALIVARTWVTAAAARGELAEAIAWEEATRRRWQFGLADAAASPDLAEVASRLDAARRVARAGTGDERAAAALAERLELMRHRLEDEPSPTALPAGTSGDVLVVDALLRLETDPRLAIAALDSAEAARWTIGLDRARCLAWSSLLRGPSALTADDRGRLLAFVAQVSPSELPAARAALLPALLTRHEALLERGGPGGESDGAGGVTAQDEWAGLAGALGGVGEVCARLGAADALAAAKRQAVERLAPGWAQELTGARTTSARSRCIRRLRAVVQAAPPCEAPAAMSAAMEAVIQAVAVPLKDLRGGDQDAPMLVDALRLDDEVRAVNPTHAPPAELMAAFRSLVELAAFPSSTPGAWRATVWSARHGLPLDQAQLDAAVRGRTPVAEMLRELPRSRAVRYVIFEARRRASQQRGRGEREGLAGLRDRVEAAAAVGAADLEQDLAPLYVLDAGRWAAVWRWDVAVFESALPTAEDLRVLADAARLLCPLAERLVAEPGRADRREMGQRVRDIWSVAAYALSHADHATRAAAWQEALRRVEAVPGLSPEQRAQLLSSVRANHADQLGELGRSEELLVVGREYLALAPNQVGRDPYEVRVMLLRAFGSLGRDDEARAWLQEERARRPQVFQAQPGASPEHQELVAEFMQMVQDLEAGPR